MFFSVRIRQPSKRWLGVRGRAGFWLQEVALPTDTSGFGIFAPEPASRPWTPNRKSARCCGRLSTRRLCQDTDSQTMKLTFGSFLQWKRYVLKMSFGALKNI